MTEMTEFEKQSLDWFKSIHKELRTMKVRLETAIEKMGG